MFIGLQGTLTRSETASCNIRAIPILTISLKLASKSKARSGRRARATRRGTGAQLAMEHVLVFRRVVDLLARDLAPRRGHDGPNSDRREPNPSDPSIWVALTDRWAYFDWPPELRTKAQDAEMTRRAIPAQKL